MAKRNHKALLVAKLEWVERDLGLVCALLETACNSLDAGVHPGPELLVFERTSLELNRVYSFVVNTVTPAARRRT